MNYKKKTENIEYTIIRGHESYGPANVVLSAVKKCGIFMYCRTKRYLDFLSFLACSLHDCKEIGRICKGYLENQKNKYEK